MRFVLASIVLFLLPHFGYTQQNNKPVLMDLTLSAKDFVPSPPPEWIPKGSSRKSFFQGTYFKVQVGVAIVFLGGGIVRWLRRRK